MLDWRLAGGGKMMRDARLVQPMFSTPPDCIADRAEQCTQISQDPTISQPNIRLVQLS